MYKWKNEDESTEFEVTPAGAGLLGTYTGGKESHVEYTTQIEAGYDSPAVMPAGWWAQEGYMTTDPVQKGLGYMMVYAAGMMAQEEDIHTIYVSSGSVAGGGQAFIASLGGEADHTLEFNLKHGEEKAKLPGYVIKVDEMVEHAKSGYAKNGWELEA